MKYFKQNYNIDPKLVCFDKKKPTLYFEETEKKYFSLTFLLWLGQQIGCLCFLLL